MAMPLTVRNAMPPKCRDEISTFCGELVEYQIRRDIWVAHNFPPKGETPGIPSTLGIIEECGELAHAILKRQQKIRGSYEDHTIAAMDAVGDLTVYLWGITGAHHVVFDDVFCRDIVNAVKVLVIRGLPLDYLVMSTASAIGKLCHSLNFDLKLDTPRHVARVIGCLWTICESQEWDYRLIVNETWAAVEQRDWIKYPDTGLPKD